MNKSLGEVHHLICYNVVIHFILPFCKFNVNDVFNFIFLGILLNA